jgi:hypothetical protein
MIPTLVNLPEFTLDSAAMSSGLYRMPTTMATTMATTMLPDLDRLGFRVFRLEGMGITDRSSYLHAVATLFEFGPQFGQNWDALADSLTDLAWGEDDRIVVIYSDCDLFAMAHPDEWEIVMEIWQRTVEFWQAQGVMLAIVFQGE